MMTFEEYLKKSDYKRFANQPPEVIRKALYIAWHVSERNTQQTVRDALKEAWKTNKRVQQPFNKVNGVILKITCDGDLWISRAGKWKAQVCPIMNDIRSSCGDWCPLFDDSMIYKTDGPGLCLCQANYPGAAVIDERGDGE